MDQLGKLFGGEKKKKGKVRIEQAFLQLLFCWLERVSAGSFRVITR